MKKIYGFTPYLVEPYYPFGVRIEYRFPNGYGASIIPDGSLDGELKELAVKKQGADGWNVITRTPVAYDVLRLEIQEIPVALLKISHLTDDAVAAYRLRLLKDELDD